MRCKGGSCTTPPFFVCRRQDRKGSRFLWLLSIPQLNGSQIKCSCQLILLICSQRRPDNSEPGAPPAEPEPDTTSGGGGTDTVKATKSKK